MVAANIQPQPSSNGRPKRPPATPVMLAVGPLSIHVVPDADERGLTVSMLADGRPAASVRFALNGFPSTTLEVADSKKLMLGFDGDGSPVCFAFDSRDELIGVHPIDRFDPPASEADSAAE